MGKPTQEYFKGKHAYNIGKPIHKVGAIIGTFKRVLNNSSTPELFSTAMDEKYAELKSLKYSHRLLSNIVYKLYLQSKIQGNENGRWLQCYSNFQKI